MELNGNSILWFLAIVLLAGGGLNGFFGGGRPAGPPPATIEDVNNAVNNQALQNQMYNLGMETANNNYQTALLVQQQTGQLLQQNNANQVNLLQGYNNMVMQLQAQYAQLSQQMTQLGYHMDQCCCEIKTQNLENRLADKTAEAVALQNRLDNAQQTQTILGNLGRFVAWAGSGSQAAAVAAG